MVIAKFQVRERGATPRKFRKAFNAASKQSWHETGQHFHETMREDRFTQRHATLAGYTPRKNRYQAQKFKAKGHTRPLEFSGTARRLTRMASISSTSKGNSVRYPGARVFNFRHPKSDVNMVQEFTTVTQQEADRLAGFYDRQLDKLLDQ